MSTVDKLIALKLTGYTGEAVYDSDPGSDDVLHRREGIEVVSRNDRDDDEAWNHYDIRSSVVIRFDNEFFKSFQYSGSYGVPTWSQWYPVNVKLVTKYELVPDYDRFAD